MALTPPQRIGPPPGNLPVDAHGCIMVRSAADPEYKSVDAMFRVHWRVLLGSSWENVTVTIDNRNSACPDLASALPR